MDDPLAMASRTLIGSVLLIAAFAKGRHGLRYFERAIQGYRILPFGWTFAARALVVLEACIGALLVTGRWPEIVTVGAAALLGAFAAAMTLSLLHGGSGDCGCRVFGERIRWRLVYRNVALSALLALGAGSSATVVLLVAVSSGVVLGLAQLTSLVPHRSSLPKFVGGGLR